MPRSRLPDFSAPTNAELRDIWRRHKGDDPVDRTVRRLVLEIVHTRDVIVELHSNFGAVQRAWFDETRSKLVGIEQMRIQFIRERSRFGSLTTEPPPAHEDAHRRYP